MIIEGQLRKVYTAQEMDPASVAMILEQFRGWINYLALLVPMTFLFLWHIASMGVFFWGARRFGDRFGILLDPLPAFSTWKADWNLIWVFLGGWLLFNGAGWFAPLGLENLMRMIGANCLTISKVLYSVLGFSLLFYYFGVYQVSSPNRVGLSIIATFFYQVPIWLGIADIWFDFRAPKAPETKKDAADDSDSFF